jgi:D-lactate dehydrogenase (cytochrome)
MMKPGSPNPEGRRYVEELRTEIVELMLAHGGAHLQIGRAYPFLRERPAPFSSMIHSLKQATDPGNLINPGALGLGAAAAGTDANS